MKKKKTGLESIMICHGKTTHKFGMPCVVCERVHAENPYVQSLLRKQKLMYEKELWRRHKIFEYLLEEYKKIRMEIIKIIKGDADKEGFCNAAYLIEKLKTRYGSHERKTK